MWNRSRLCCIAILFLLSSSPASALSDEEIFRDFRFNLTNPGARSLAMGGAFTSLADDATAAQANPAGLSFLLYPEYFLELRAVDNAASSSIRRESLVGVDTFVATGTDLDDVTSPSFASAVTVYGKWTMGLSRQELLNIDNRTLSSFAFTFPDSPGAFLAEGQGFVDVDVTNFNVSVGVRVNDQLGVGATLTLSRLDVESEVTNVVVDTNAVLADSEILEPTLDLRTRINDSDEEVVFGLGVIYKRQRWGAGAVYRRGPHFRVTETIAADGIDLFDVRSRFSPSPTTEARFLNRFHLPDILGIGGHGVFFDDRLTLALNAERIWYTNLLDGYVAGVNVLTSSDATFTIDDATDVRFGAEYLLPPRLALRAGVFTEEDSTIRSTFTGSESFATTEVFAGRDTQVHGAVGIGIYFEKWKVDLAADVAETDNEYLVSVIYQGKRR